MNQIFSLMGAGGKEQRSARILESVRECLRLSLLFVLLFFAEGMVRFEGCCAGSDPTTFGQQS